MSTLEIAGFITCIVCVYLNIKQNIWGWPVGMASIIIFGFVFFDAKLYANMALQVFFMFFSIKGLLLWNTKSKHGLELQIGYTTKKEWLYLAIGTAFFTGILVGFLDKYTDSDTPFLDAITTLVSIAAQILLGKKRIENWFLWLFVNVIIVYLCYQKQLYISSVLYIILTFMAIIGYWQWRKDMLKNKIFNMK